MAQFHAENAERNKMQHQKVSFDLTENYISKFYGAPTADNFDPSDAIENGLMRDIVNENLTKRQKCYIIKYYNKGMTMQQIAESEGVSRSTVSRTLGLARKKISCGLKPAILRSVLKNERKA